MIDHLGCLTLSLTLVLCWIITELGQNLWLTCHALEGHTVHRLGLWSSRSSLSSAISLTVYSGKITVSLACGYWKQGTGPHIFCDFLYTSEVNMPQRWKTLCRLEVSSNFSSPLHFPSNFGVRILGGKCVSFLLQLNFIADPVGLEFPVITNAILPMGQECFAPCNGVHDPFACRRLCLSVWPLTGAGEQSIQG